MPVVSSSPIAAVLDHLTEQVDGGASTPTVITDGDRRRLLEALAQVPDPRAQRGVRYPFVAILVVAVSAMVGGARSFAAIGEWVADLPADVRAGLGLVGRIPGPVTIWRVLTAVDRAALEAAIGAWIRACMEAADAALSCSRQRRARVCRVIAVDGKAMRATCHGQAGVHLLGAFDHARGVVLAQVDVDAKTNEISVFSTLLDQIEDLTDVVVTVDAMHAQTAHADYLHARGAHLLVTVKGNQPTLHARLKALPWKDVPVGHTATGRGHGRIEKPTLRPSPSRPDSASRMPPRPSRSPAPPTRSTNGARTTASATACGGRPSTRSRPCPPSRPALPSWPPGSVDSGRSRTGCIGSETSRSVRIFTRPAPAAAPKSWLRYATWSSVCCVWQAIPTLPEPYASTPVILIKPSPS